MPFHTNHYYATEFCKHQQQYTSSSVDLCARECTSYNSSKQDLI